MGAEHLDMRSVRLPTAPNGSVPEEIQALAWRGHVEERRMATLVQSLLPWLTEATLEESSEMRQGCAAKIQRLLDQAQAAALQPYEAGMASFRELDQTVDCIGATGQASAQLDTELQALLEGLASARTERAQRQQYDTLAQATLALPARATSMAQIEALEAQIEAATKEKDRLDQQLAVRKAQFLGPMVLLHMLRTDPAEQLQDPAQDGDVSMAEGPP